SIGLQSSDEGGTRLSITTLREKVQEARTQLNVAIKSIRGIVGYEDFLAEPDFNDVVRALRSGIPLIYLVTTRSGSLALLVYKGVEDSSTDPTTTSMEAVWAHSLTH